MLVWQCVRWLMDWGVQERLQVHGSVTVCSTDEDATSAQCMSAVTRAQRFVTATLLHAAGCTHPINFNTAQLLLSQLLWQSFSRLIP
jgi:hypothetical protein